MLIDVPREPPALGSAVCIIHHCAVVYFPRPVLLPIVKTWAEIRSEEEGGDLGSLQCPQRWRELLFLGWPPVFVCEEALNLSLFLFCHCHHLLQFLWQFPHHSVQVVKKAKERKGKKAFPSQPAFSTPLFAFQHPHLAVISAPLRISPPVFVLLFFPFGFHAESLPAETRDSQQAAHTDRRPDFIWSRKREPRKDTLGGTKQAAEPPEAWASRSLFLSGIGGRAVSSDLKVLFPQHF